METDKTVARGSHNEKAIIEDGRLIIELTCAYCTETFWVDADDPEAAPTGCCPDCVGADRHWKVPRRGWR